MAGTDCLIYHLTRALKLSQSATDHKDLPSGNAKNTAGFRDRGELSFSSFMADNCVDVGKIYTRLSDWKTLGTSQAC